MARTTIIAGDGQLRLGQAEAAAGLGLEAVDELAAALRLAGVVEPALAALDVQAGIVGLLRVLVVGLRRATAGGGHEAEREKGGEPDRAGARTRTVGGVHRCPLTTMA